MSELGLYIVKPVEYSFVFLNIQLHCLPKLDAADSVLLMWNNILIKTLGDITGNNSHVKYGAKSIVALVDHVIDERIPHVDWSI